MPWHEASCPDKEMINEVTNGEKRFVLYRVAYCHKPFLVVSISCLKRPNINRKSNNNNFKVCVLNHTKLDKW